jgi:hypothetical protein
LRREAKASIAQGGEGKHEARVKDGGLRRKETPTETEVDKGRNSFATLGEIG